MLDESTFPPASEKMPLPLHGLFVCFARTADALHLRDFCHGDIPPGFIAGNTRVAIDLNHRHSGSLVGSRGDQRLPQFIESAYVDSVSAETSRIRDEINVGHISSELSVLPEPVFRAESPAPARFAQRADAPESVVIEHHDIQFDPFLNGSMDLLRHHQIGSISD